MLRRTGGSRKKRKWKGHTHRFLETQRSFHVSRCVCGELRDHTSEWHVIALFAHRRVQTPQSAEMPHIARSRGQTQSTEVFESDLVLEVRLYEDEDREDQRCCGSRAFVSPTGTYGIREQLSIYCVWLSFSFLCVPLILKHSTYTHARAHTRHTRREITNIHRVTLTDVCTSLCASRETCGRERYHLRL